MSMCVGSWLAVVAVMAIAAGSSADASCQEGWERWGDFCYTSLPGLRKKANATSACLSLGARLATPGDPDEHGFVWRLFTASLALPANATPSHGVWTSCTDYSNEGSFVCDGEPIPYRPEPFTEYQRCGVGECRCAVLGVDYPAWVKQRCRGWKFTVCKAPAPAVMCRASRCLAAGPGRCLQRQYYRVVPAAGPGGCCSACNRDWRCRSFNVKDGQCYLNFATRYDVPPGYFLKDPDCTYYGMASSPCCD